MNRDGCHDTCTDGWIRSRGQWIQCPNHRVRHWPIGPTPPPIKTARAREVIAEAKAIAARAAANGQPDDDPDDERPVALLLLRGGRQSRQPRK